MLGKLGVYTGINHPQGDAMLTGEHIDGRALVEEVMHHLCGHRAGISRYTMPAQAMVGGEYPDLRLAYAWGPGVLDQAQLQGQLFQPAQGAERLGLVVDSLLQLPGQGGIGEWGYGW
ncbi:hypothetical protein GCM10022394_09860 [Zobellella aerophila]|uniref:Uncharacterized protein n=1 Tax=Zobellella aerophila TaxID=870480 RepID=A0ABP6VGD6_9GAMM